VSYRVSFRINHVLSERARVKPARVPARKDSSTRKNRYLGETRFPSYYTKLPACKTAIALKQDRFVLFSAEFVEPLTIVFSFSRVRELGGGHS
jgi:hypothetical protein